MYATLGTMSRAPLTNASYLILGLVELMGPTTPYDLESVVQRSGMMNFWWLPHTQLYNECARLAGDGYLEEEREEDGRRKRLYQVTDAGREALSRWRTEPLDEPEQTRDPALLKLFFGGDPSLIATAEVERHRRQLDAHEQVAAKVGGRHYGGRGTVLAYSLAYERMALDFWSQVAKQATEGEMSEPNETYGSQLFGPL
jgi:PadR family transcriptional regulator, regulatory protein AphA